MNTDSNSFAQKKHTNVWILIKFIFQPYHSDGIVFNILFPFSYKNTIVQYRFGSLVAVC